MVLGYIQDILHWQKDVCTFIGVMDLTYLIKLVGRFIFTLQ